MLKVSDPLEREYFLQTRPDIYYMAEHYADFNCLLVRMPLVAPDELRGLFEQAWMAFAPKRLVKAYQEKR